MQQEAFGLATILLSKLEKHSTHKQGTNMHMDDTRTRTAGQLLHNSVEWGRKSHLCARGSPGPRWHWDQKPDKCSGKQAGKRSLQGHEWAGCSLSRVKKWPDKQTSHSCKSYLSSIHLFIKHLLSVPLRNGETKVFSCVSQPSTLTSWGIPKASSGILVTFPKVSWEQISRTEKNWKQPTFDETGHKW